MKKYLLIVFAAAIAFAACEKTPKNEPMAVTVALEINGEAYNEAGVTVALRDINGTTGYEAQTDETGTATFNVLAGLYEASVSFKTAVDGELFVYNGLNSNISVMKGEANAFTLALVESKSNQVIIKELYSGGCKNNEGKTFQNDSYMILYNNSDTEADAGNISIAMCLPLNSNAANKFLVDGELTYIAEGWVPAGYAIWWFETDVKIPAYSQAVISIKGAIDHSATVTNSVDLSNADYVMYDPESGLNMASYYPAPSGTIPSDHYMQTYLFGSATGWPLSTASPAVFLISNPDIEAFSQNEANYDFAYGQYIGNVVKVPVEDIIDGVEVFAIGKEAQNAKRLPSSVDAGYVYHTNGNGYTVYRNVDKDATEAIEGNKDLLVYNYSLGTESIDQTTDPSGIDAEASIANGAKIVYMDTNNSTNDFHLRSRASLKK